jgi:hypothetical protein
MAEQSALPDGFQVRILTLLKGIEHWAQAYRVRGNGYHLGLAMIQAMRVGVGDSIVIGGQCCERIYGKRS